MQSTSLVDQVIIKPMVAKYQAPAHLRNNSVGMEYALDDYRKGLAGFSEKSLKAAWEKVVQAHTTWVWPVVGVFVKAIREEGEGAAIARDYDLEQLDSARSKAKADKLLADYLASFKRSALYQQATNEAWLGELVSYVNAVADYQSQLIAKVARPSIDWMRVFPFSNLVSVAKKTPRDMQEYQREQAMLVADGVINIQIPASYLEAWKVRALNRDNALPEVDAILAAKRLQRHAQEVNEKIMMAG